MREINVNAVRIRGNTAMRSFGDLISCIYKKQNTNFIWENHGNFNWQRISSIIEFITTARILFRARNNLSNLSETFGDGQRQSYDSLEACLEELFKRCEKFARQKKRDLMLFKFTTGVCGFLYSVFTFIIFELGFGFVTFEGRSKIAFALFELVSTACLVYYFVFAWGIFADILFFDIFLLRTLCYFLLAIKSGVELYQKK